MNDDLIQGIRYKLQKRVRRLNSTTHDNQYRLVLKQFWHFLQQHPILWGVIQDLRLRHSAVPELAGQIAEGTAAFSPPTEEHQASLAIALCELVLDSDDDKQIMWTLGYCLPGSPISEVQEAVERFHELIVEPLYEYMDEALDDRRALLSLFLRYKHRCEWFQREALFKLWGEDTQGGEKRLALDFYEYLFNQGLDFSIEPSSASGEADLVSAQLGDSRIVADAKIFNPDKGKGKSYIVRAVNQIYVYVQDYNEPFGYLVIYQTGDSDLRLALSDSTSGVPYLEHNGKGLFFIVIDIFPHEETASKRGGLKVIEVTEGDLVSLLDDHTPDMSDSPVQRSGQSDR